MSDKKRGSDDHVRKGRVGRRIAPEFDRLARGEKPARQSRRRLDDPRQHALIRGVANRDVRMVAEHHRDRLAGNLAQESPALRAELEMLLGAEIWRGLSFISKKAFLEDGLELAREHWAHQVKPRRDMAEPTIALWYRLEAARIRKGAEGSVQVVGDGKHHAVQLTLAVEHAHVAIEEMGRSVAALVRDNQPKPHNEKSRDRK